MRRTIAFALMPAVLTVLAVILMHAPADCAQVSANLWGTVSDPSGAAVSGATVTAKNVDTGLSRSTVTDPGGPLCFHRAAGWALRAHRPKGGLCRGNPQGHSSGRGARRGRRPDPPHRRGQRTVNRCRRRAAGQRHHAGHLRTGGRAAGQRPAAERAQLRSAADAQSRRRQFHLGEDRRHRDLQLHHRQQLCGFGQSAAAESVPAEWGRVHRARRRTTCSPEAPASNCWAWTRCASSTCCATPTARSTASGPAGR